MDKLIAIAKECGAVAYYQPEFRENGAFASVVCMLDGQNGINDFDRSIPKNLEVRDKWLRGHPLFTNAPDSAARIAEQSAEIARLTAELEEARKWIAKAKSLAEEARDALPAISLLSAKLHNIDLTLAERMDEHFTKPIDASLNIKGGAE